MTDSIADEALTVAAFIAALEATETWRPVVGFPCYSVSSWGRVSGPRGILKPSATQGYLHVSVCAEGAVVTKRIHVMVAEAFLGPSPFDGAEVAHNDGVRENCRVGNLRWATTIENAADVARHGMRVKGSEVFGAKLTEADIPVIRRRLQEGEGYPTIAADYGISVSSVYMIRHNRTWRHVDQQQKQVA